MRTWLWTGLLVLGASAGGAQDVYTVVSEESRMVVDVGTAGLFQMFGHEHTIAANRFEGEARWSADAPESSTFTLRIDASSLEVADEDVSVEDRAEIQADMESKALDLPAHQSIEFTSTDVEVQSSENGTYRLSVTGTLDLRGVSRQLQLPLTLEVASDRMVAEGELELESDEWGVPQISVAAGTVKTSEDLGVSFEIVARRASVPSRK